MILPHGNCLDQLKTLEANSIDSVVTDPPYGLKFMGKKWDYDVPSVEIWREVLRVLKPGGHVLSFGGTRTYHRMVVNIEDSGFEIRDQVMWIYGSGFPKSHNGEHGGTALKPANEPICLARKPIEGTVAKNFEKYGVGGLNIDASRIAAGIDHAKNCARTFQSGIWAKSGEGKAQITTEANPQGRWPANVLFDEDAAAVLDEQSGMLKSGSLKPYVAVNSSKTSMAYDGQKTWTGEANKGGASRFFYVAKASKRERGEGNSHPTVKPIKLMQYLIKLVTPQDGTVLDPFMGSGSTGVAAKSLGFQFVGIEMNEEYLEIAKGRISNGD